MERTGKFRKMRSWGLGLLPRGMMNDAERRGVIKVVMTFAIGSALILLVPVIFRIFG